MTSIKASPRLIVRYFETLEKDMIPEEVSMLSNTIIEWHLRTLLRLCPAYIDYMRRLVRCTQKRVPIMSWLCNARALALDHAPEFYPTFCVERRSGFLTYKKYLTVIGTMHDILCDWYTEMHPCSDTAKKIERWMMYGNVLDAVRMAGVKITWMDLLNHPEKAAASIS